MAKLERSKRISVEFMEFTPDDRELPDTQVMLRFVLHELGGMVRWCAVVGTTNAELKHVTEEETDQLEELYEKLATSYN